MEIGGRRCACSDGMMRWLTWLLRSALGIWTYTPHVPPALRRRPTWYGTRSGRRDWSSADMSALTPEEQQFVDALMLEHQAIRQIVDDLRRRS